MLKISILCLAISVLAACGTKQPKVTDETQLNPKNSIAHLNLKEGCADCHEAERLAATTDLNVTVPHGFGEDCSSCHTWPAFKTINASVVAHNPYPAACLGCHSVSSASATHKAQGECASCHSFPSWSTIGAKK